MSLRRILRRATSLLILCLLLLLIANAAYAQNTVSTVAGSAPPNHVSPTSAIIEGPQAVVRDTSGNLYVVNDNGVIYKVTAGTTAPSSTSIYAGNNTAGFSPNGSLATAALFYEPLGAALDVNGNLYFSDQNNCVVREIVASSGVINTVAGVAGKCGYNGDGIAATSARLYFPQGVALDGSGNLYIADINNSLVRRVDLTSGIITTYAGTPGTAGFPTNNVLATSASLNGPDALAVDTGGNLFIADQYDQVICRVDATSKNITIVAGTGPQGFSGDGGPATSATLNTPAGVAVDGAGNIYIADYSNSRVREVLSPTNPTTPNQINTIVGNSTFGYNGDGGVGTATELTNPVGLFVDAATGNLWIADYWSNRVRLYTASTKIVTTVVGSGLVGDGGPATSASLYYPRNPALDAKGDLFFVDAQNDRIREVSASDQTISTVVGTGIPCPTGTDACGDGGPATAAALFMPRTVTIEPSGNLLVADDGDNRIREVAGGIITTIVGSGNQCTAPFSSCGDGGPALSASLNDARAAVMDAAGNLYFVDAQDNRVREVDTTGTITTIAGGGPDGTAPLGCPGSYTGDGGPAVDATLSCPAGLDIDSKGNLYVSDTDNNVIRKIDTGSPRIITTIVGTGTPGHTGDGGLATSATLNSPLRVSANGAGNLFISDAGNNVIRRVDGTTGIITTFAGNLNFAFAGDGMPALSASFATPDGVVVNDLGNMYVGDLYNNRIRLVLLNPNITLSSTTVAFANQPINASATLPVTLTNSGDAPMAIADIAITSGAFSLATSATPCPASPATLAVGAQCVIEVGFTPTEFIAYTGTMTISDNAPATGSTQTVSLSGMGAAALTVKVSGSGTVTSAPTGISCPTSCSATFAGNSAVVLTASASKGSTFTSFSAPCTPASPETTPPTCTVTMSEAETVTTTFATAGAATPVLTITKSNNGVFSEGELGALYAVTVTNAGTGPTSGTVTVTETIPSGLTLDSMQGTGWTCADGGNTCTRGDALAAGASYPPIAVAVDVSDDTGSPLVNSVTVSGGGAATATGTDSTTITASAVAQAIVADFGGDYEYQDGIDDKQRIDGQTPPLQIVLTNTSTTQTVNFSSVAVDNPAYKVGMNCTTLLPGKTCVVTASFTATSTCQNLFANITVQDNDPGGNLLLGVNGFGADSNIQVDDLTDPTLSAQALAQSLVGSGVTISGVTYTGSARAAGNFTSSTNIIGFNSGIVLSTGSVRNVVGPNCVSGAAPALNDPVGAGSDGGDSGISVDNGQAGDTDLTTLGGGDTEDATVLEFDFVPTSTNISFQYVFSSDEYNEFVGEFNDVLGLFLTAPDGTPVNIAVVPGTDPAQAVSINDINSEANPQFYVNNEFLPAAAPLDTEMNGLTTALTAQATVTPGLKYHIKLAIADATDHLYDSNVFVQAGSLSSGNVTANPTSLTFGNQAQGTTSASQPVTITNVGGTTVTNVSVAASANFGETNTCPTSLVTGTGTGSSCTVNVTFAPTATGTLTGTVTVTYTSTGSATPQTTTISLTGTGTAATGGTIVIAPTTLPFGDEGVGTTSTAQTLTVSNTGSTAVTFTSIAMTGDFAGATLAQCPSIAAGAAACTFHITFTPTATGARPGTITFTDNATGSPQTVTLTGTGVPAVIGIAPTLLTFGSQVVGTTSAAQTVTVSNNGEFPLIFSNIVTSGDFAGATLAQCTSIGVEAPSCVFSITFKPTATGPLAGAITFTDNATGSPQTVTLSGTGTAGTATLTVTPGSLTFGSQTVSTTSAAQSVTVKNTSTATVNFTGFTISGEDGEDFAVPAASGGACNPTGTLAAGASCTINVAFTPGAAGTRSATLNIADNATGSPQAVTLSGTGVTSSVIIAVAPGGSSTATTVSGGTAYYGLTIAGAPGVTGTVQLGCVPSSVLITCKVIPGAVTLNGGTTEVAFAIQTFCQGATTATGLAAPGGGGGLGRGIGMLLATMMLGGLVWMFRRNRRVALTFATLLLVALGAAACNSLPSGPNGATPAGTYSLSLTSSLNGGPTQTLNNFLTLVVK